MDIRTGFDGLKSLLGVSQPSTASSQTARSSQVADSSSLWSDRATLSDAGSEVAQTAGESSVRADKVASIQAALAAGTYNVSSSLVASRMVDSMLAAGR